MPGRPANRLADEASPYLQQHAHNPVDWYPWGPDALARAKAEDKPILLSIGYSACHWCHVMERESFENDEIARQMNDAFIPIKVDREERPDLDHIYQLVVQLMGRSGGWPLTVFLTPDQRPFFAGTYFPPEDRHGMPGFPRVLAAVAEAYRDKRADVELQGQELAQAIARVGELEQRGEENYVPGPDLVERASRKLAARFDERHGGFGTRPKFPNTMCLEVFLRQAAGAKDETAAARVKLALDGMRKGGIWDHLAGGFHRYSTDERWLVPHFEKMLYDNALLLRMYCDAYRAFGDEAYAATASDIGTYLLREMQSPEGGFYSAQDADSEEEEGKFFVWTDREVRELFADDPLARDVVLRYFGITPDGNFESTGATVLAENRPERAVADALGRPLGEVEEALARAIPRMLVAREKRERPFRDDKVLASWNGLVIAALADASLTLGEPALLAAAEKAFDQIAKSLVSSGRVMRLLKGYVVKGPGFLDDHAFVGAAALELYETTFDTAKLEVAKAIADEILSSFWDPAGKGFFFTPKDGEKLIHRGKDAFDQAIPSGSAIAALLLLKLGEMVDEKYLPFARAYLTQVAPAALANPFAFGQTIAVIDRLVRGSTDIVIVGNREDPRTRALHRAAFSPYLLDRNVVVADPEDPASMAATPLLASDKPRQDAPAAYVCRRRTCSAPVTSPEELLSLLRSDV
jgi:uncharacterized protein YyaL (SSP411 family)